MIPEDFQASMKKCSSSNAVLEQAVTYMRHLKDQHKLLLSENGSQVQFFLNLRVFDFMMLGEEIKRLKEELLLVKSERDVYAKMVQQAAAVTPQMLLNSKTNTGPLPTCQSLETVSADQIKAKLPGQGLLITQTGHTYYVNEEGIPVAQGMATTPLLPDNVLLKPSSIPPTPSAANQPPVCVEAEPLSAPVDAASTTTVSSTSIPVCSSGVMSTCAVTNASIPRGLVALPGHTGQVPNAIILSTGHIIPVATSTNSTLNTPSSSAVPHSTADVSDITSHVSTNTPAPSVSASSATSTTPTTSSPGILLSATTLQNIYSAPLANSGVMAELGDGSSFCKIMPKPAMYTSTPQKSHNVMADTVRLTPIPLPTCSVSVAPSLFKNAPEPAKKKRNSRKKKAKDGEVMISSDILAAATANIFTSGNNGTTQSQQNSAETDAMTSHGMQSSLIPVASTIIVPTEPLNPMPIPTLPLTGVRARRTRKRKIKEKEAKAAAAAAAAADSEDPPSAKLTKRSVSQDDEKIEENSGQCVTTCASDANPQAIEFDSNDIDNILDQVENYDERDSQQPSSVMDSDDKLTKYQVVNGDEEIGHVFTTPSSNKTSTESSTYKSNTHNLQILESLPSAPSDSYLIGNLTKTTEQPVDHRQKPNKPEATLGSDASHQGSYTAGFAPYQSVNTVQQESSHLPAPEILPKAQNVDNSSVAVDQDIPSHSYVKVSYLSKTEPEKNLENCIRSTSAMPMLVSDSKTVSSLSQTELKHDSLVRGKSPPVSTLPSEPFSYNKPDRVNSMQHTSQGHSVHTSQGHAVHTSQGHSVYTSVFRSGTLSAPAWSPAKDLENMATSITSHTPHTSYSSAQSCYTPLQHSSNKYSHSSANGDAGNVHKSSFQDMPYQYPQFTSSSTTVSVAPPGLLHSQTDSSQFHMSNLAASKSQVYQSRDGNNYSSSQQLWPCQDASRSDDPFDHRQALSNQVPTSLPAQVLDATAQENVKKHAVKKVVPKSKVSSKRSAAGNDAKLSQPTTFHQNVDSASMPSQESYQSVQDLPFGLSSRSTSSHLNNQPSRDANVSQAKQNVFSTEALLNKNNSDKEVSKNFSDSVYSRYQPPVPLISHTNDNSHINKEPRLIANQMNNPAFNMSLFNSATHALNSLSSSFSDPSFTFSLANSSGSLPAPASNPYHPSSSTAVQRPFLLPPASQSHSFSNINAPQPNTNLLSQNKSVHDFIQNPLQPYGSSYSSSVEQSKKLYEKKSEPRSMSQPANSTKAKRSKSRQTEVTREAPIVPPNYPNQSYGVPAFPINKELDATVAANPTNFYNSQSMYNKPSNAFPGLSFQHPGFSSLQRSSHPFQNHPDQIHQSSTKFNLNNIFKESPSVDSFKHLNGNTAHSSVYSPQTSHLYHNPMSINNILGNAPGFDSNRMSAFSGAHSFAGFHPAFDFNVSGQP
ncbi:hypothetical protein EB796_011476 [Bugula neritina]|uniref:BHLH domain-containing protein n=1 Tax=Bugula neritina TaxID=10212 RepID=A0A7J7JWH6_BUGNE|nr:hypothetical protein EB796_011476 [Bugula neritina]